MAETIEALAQDYSVQGWCRVSLPDPLIVAEIRDALESRLRHVTGRPDATLATYHAVVDDTDHTKVQWDLVNFFWSEDCCLKIAQRQLDFFRPFIGPDLHVQRRPYLRIARPGKPEDNIGFHRDTVYGQSPYEVAVHLPFLELDEGSSLRMLPSSHVAPESAFEVVAHGDAPHVRGSEKHEMGFPYAPKTIAVDVGQMIPLPLDFGQALVFTPSIVHGQDVNRGTVTRVSVDFRVVNSFAPVAFRTDPSSRGYCRLAESAVSAVARRYAENASMQPEGSTAAEPARG